MIPRLAPLALLAAAGAVAVHAAGIPKIASTPRDLRAMPSAQLGALMFGRAAPAFAFTRVEAPATGYSTYFVRLATPPTPSGYHGLCVLKEGWMAFMSLRSADVGDDRPVKGASSANIYDAFILAPGATLASTGASGTACTGPGSARDAAWWENVHPLYYRPDRLKPADSPGIARFGLAALLAARNAAGTVLVTASQCDSGDEQRQACRDPKGFLAGIDVADIDTIWVGVIGNRLQVSIRLWQRDRRSTDDLAITTGETTIGSDPAALPAIRSIEIISGGRRIID